MTSQVVNTTIDIDKSKAAAINLPGDCDGSNSKQVISMVSALYQSKIDAFQSQIAALQTRIDRLTKAQLSSDQAITSVKAALQQVTEADPDEVASLKAELLALFGSNDDGSGGQPISPTPITPAP